MTDNPVHERIADDRAHYLAHPDEDEWEDAPAPADGKAKRQTGTMISVRLSASEADEIRAAADAAGLPVSAFVRQAVLDHVRGSAVSVGVIASTSGSLRYGVGHIEFQPGAPVSGSLQSSGVLVA